MLRQLLILLTIPLSVLAQEKPDTMNGYSLSQFKDFEKNWKLVTVRYRADSSEMRFVYANPIAWEALQKRSIDYPDGAVFAKIGLVAKSDEAFESSKVPSGARRYQLMVRDHAKHKETGGWGYALFDSEGLRFAGDVREATVACYACHKIVPDRGEVFSKPMRLGLNEKDFSIAKDQEKILFGKKTESASRLSFSARKRIKLPSAVRKELPNGFKEVRLVGGELQKHIFPGTIHEIQPELIRETLRSKQPAVIHSEDGKEFAVVYRDPDQGLCVLPTGKKGAFLKISSTIQGERSMFVSRVVTCEPEN